MTNLLESATLLIIGGEDYLCWPAARSIRIVARDGYCGTGANGMIGMIIDRRECKVYILMRENFVACVKDGGGGGGCKIEK